MCVSKISGKMHGGNIGSFGKEIWVARQMWNERDFTIFLVPFEL